MVVTLNGRKRFGTNSGKRSVTVRSRFKIERNTVLDFSKVYKIFLNQFEIYLDSLELFVQNSRRKISTLFFIHENIYKY